MGVDWLMSPTSLPLSLPSRAVPGSPQVFMLSFVTWVRRDTQKGEHKRWGSGAGMSVTGRGWDKGGWLVLEILVDLPVSVSSASGNIGRRRGRAMPSPGLDVSEYHAPSETENARV